MTLSQDRTESIETRPDGTTIKYVSIDLTQIDPDEIDELDRPSYRDVERMIKYET